MVSMINGCDVQSECNFPFPLKKPVALAPWQIAIYMAEFASGKTEHFSREETDLIGPRVSPGY